MIAGQEAALGVGEQLTPGVRRRGGVALDAVYHQHGAGVQ